jgi:hypothetical protein
MLQDRGQKYDVIGLSKAPRTFDRGAFHLEAVFLCRDPRKRFSHLYTADSPSSIDRTTQKLSTTTTELEHTAWSPKHGFRKGRQLLSQGDLAQRRMVLKVLLWRAIRVWVEFRDQGGTLIHSMALRASNDPRLDALPVTMSATTSST